MKGGTQPSLGHPRAVVAVTTPVLTANKSPPTSEFPAAKFTHQGWIKLCFQGLEWFQWGRFGLSSAGWSRQVEGNTEISTGLAHASSFPGFNVFIVISCPAKACKGCTPEMSTGECQSQILEMGMVFGDLSASKRQGQVSSCRYRRKSLLPLEQV